ncbi:MAG: phosphohistidine phosphatase SixA [Elusimicrobia bacterium]|nr:phosphohistidine phosphatase SixA [Elusimicrobiota bacterium]
MQILIIRHAPAGERVQWSKKGKPDELRPLTEKGRQKMRRIAKGLASLVSRLNIVISSPLARALETADILAKSFPSVKLEKLEDLKPGGDPENVFARLAKLEAGAIGAVVGHEPDLSALLARMLTGEPDSFTDLKKGAAALVEFESAVRPGRGALLWLLQPSQLRKL